MSMNFTGKAGLLQLFNASRSAEGQVALEDFHPGTPRPGGHPSRDDLNTVVDIKLGNDSRTIYRRYFGRPDLGLSLAALDNKFTVEHGSTVADLIPALNTRATLKLAVTDLMNEGFFSSGVHHLIAAPASLLFVGSWAIDVTVNPPADALADDDGEPPVMARMAMGPQDEVEPPAEESAPEPEAPPADEPEVVEEAAPETDVVDEPAVELEQDISAELAEAITAFANDPSPTTYAAYYAAAGITDAEPYSDELAEALFELLVERHPALTV